MLRWGQSSLVPGRRPERSYQLPVGPREFFGPTEHTKADDGLLHLCCLMLSGLLLSFLLSVLLRKVSSDYAAANCPDDRVMSSIVTGNSTDDRAFEAACGVRRAY